MSDVTPILIDAKSKREAIRRKALEGLRAAFPMPVRDMVLELDDVRVHEKDHGPEDQKQALLAGTSLHEPVKGTLLLKDATGKVIDKAKDVTLLHLPYFTERHTFIVDGNEYQVANQVRMRPGIYTRRRANEEIETMFNIVHGPNFRMGLDEEKGHPFLKYESTKIPLYPALRALGIPHDQIKAKWGAEVADDNRGAYERKVEAMTEKLYEKAVPKSWQEGITTHEGRVTALERAYKQTVMDPMVNKWTVGHPHDKVSAQAMLDASKKLLDVYRRAEEVDDRDSLAFKTFHSVDDFVKERIKLDARSVAMKVRGRASSKSTVREILPPAPFTGGLRAFLTGSQLSAIPTQINPMEMIDRAVKVTAMGEGGISSDRAVPLDARQVHFSHLGIIDSVRTPESFSAGVDVRTAMLAHRDEEGNLYTPLRNVKTGKFEMIPVKRYHEDVVVAFPGQTLRRGTLVQVMKQGVVSEVPLSEVTHQVYHGAQLYSPAANLIPFAESSQGNRLLMGAKMQTQALPLVGREVPLVQVGAQIEHVATGKHSTSSFEEELGHLAVPCSPFAGTIKKIDGQYIHIVPDGHKRGAADDDGAVKVPYETMFPFASKTFIHQDLNCKVGDSVKKGQVLGESNFTRGGVFALGRNMQVAYMPYYGLNSNDAVVISAGASEKLTSEHMYKEMALVEPGVTLGRSFHQQYYGAKYTRAMYAKLDSSGTVRKGEKVMPHDLLIVGVRKATQSAADAILGNLKRSLLSPYREVVHTWDHDFEGEVIDVFQTEKRVVVTIKTREPIRVGDKIAGRYGNKGVVSHIVPDHQMIQDTHKNPVDILYTSMGVISRINPSQLLETSLAKVAQKTGKPIIVDTYGRDGTTNPDYVQKLLKEHKVEPFETVHDPISGRDIPGILVGPQYTLRLFKTTDSNYSARGAGDGYDVNRQPSKGGDEGAKGIGRMEFNVLVAHGARNVLRESATIKSERSDEFWRAAQLGLPLPVAKAPFVFDKFVGMLRGAGINVDRHGSSMTLLPLTDRDVMKMSAGTIDNEKLVRAKDLRPEKGGLFDPVATGGAVGTKWSHVDLAEPLLHPIFHEPVKRLLGMTNDELDKLHGEKGGNAIKALLKKIDVKDKLKELHDQSKTFKGSKLDDVVKQIKYLESLQRAGLEPHEAYVISKLPVLPPVMRPIQPGHGAQDLVVGDANYLYQSAILHNQALRQQNEDNTLPPEEHAQLRANLVNAIGAVIGTHETDNQKLQKRNVKGLLVHLTGKTTPKCYDDQTEVLTKRGWVLFKDYVAGVPAGTVNLDTGEFEWQLPTRVIDEAYTGRMVHTATKKVDLCVTPNHEHVVSVRRQRVVDGRRTHTWTHWSKQSAPSLMCSDRKRLMVSATRWHGKTPALAFDGHAVQDTLAFAQFVGWWVAEGWLQGRSAALCQAAKSKKHVAMVDACVRRMGLPFERTVYTRANGYRVVWWVLKNRSLYMWLKRNCGAGAENKFLSTAILNWPTKHLVELLRGYMNGDGSLSLGRVSGDIPVTYYRKKEITGRASTVSPRLVDSLQHLGVKTGYHVTLLDVVQPPNPAHQVQYVMHVHGFNDVTIERSAQSKYVGYSGRVYCMEVPNGTLVVRRNGRPAVSGNSSFFQKKIMKRQQDLSGRGTAAPDGTLGMDEIGLPDDMLWGIFGKFIIGRLVRRGFGAMQAKEMLEKKHPAARDALLAECAERPVFLNRAPTLHRHGILGAYAKPVAGKTIRVNPFIESGMNLDYDGDTLQIHAPVSPAAVADVKQMTISKMLFGDRSRDNLLVAPTMEAVLGVHLASQPATGKKLHTYKSQAEAVAAWKRGEINISDPVEIKT